MRCVSMRHVCCINKFTRLVDGLIHTYTWKSDNMTSVMTPDECGQEPSRGSLVRRVYSLRKPELTCLVDSPLQFLLILAWAWEASGTGGGGVSESKTLEWYSPVMVIFALFLDTVSKFSHFSKISIKWPKSEKYNFGVITELNFVATPLSFSSPHPPPEIDGLDPPVSLFVAA